MEHRSCSLICLLSGLCSMASSGLSDKHPDTVDGGERAEGRT